MSAIPPEIFIVDEDDAGYTWYLVRRLCKPQQADDCVKPKAVKTAEVSLQRYDGTPVELMRVPYGLLKRGALIVGVRFNPLPLEECGACPARYIYYFSYDYAIRNYINCEMHVRFLADDDNVLRNVGTVLHKFDVFDGAVEHTFYITNDYANGIVYEDYYVAPETDCEADKLEVKVVYEGCEASNLYIYAVLYVL